ncbi:MAG: Gluconolactonase [Alphaproteobacteria bacterium MarineAlpha5_Bin5]|nr:MAG: Gluconolactonase [Alphaproteobacteria bacterium MarineAlpha5_Bin5]PPR51526.1 MAG: Gluconolactonase [Alphaproteobacteria bacterium MarineAlpha5_Bin4]|tara:strand:+ start:10819 stop:11769 length:951 start_codon:yes stop_codon:yes gene_type:complete
MNTYKFLPPDQEPKNAAFRYKNVKMEPVENSNLFNSYIKKNIFKKEFTGTLWGEGPCYINQKDILVWSDIPNNRMMKLDKGTVTEFLNPSNYCNGNTTDNYGNLISCSHGGRCVYKADSDFNLSVLVDNFNGNKFNSPNDICVKSDGTIWFTDPPYGILSDYEGYPGEKEYAGCYVFRYNPKNDKLDVITKELNKPNGIAFSNDEKKIYISDTGENIKCLFVYDVIDNKIQNKNLVYDFKPFFSDGFRCDKDGNIWTSAGKAIKCFNSKNELIGQILVPELVSNLEFGGKEGNILYVTATTSLYSMELNQTGAKYL